MACLVLLQTSIFKNKGFLLGKIYDIGLARIYTYVQYCYFVFQSEEVCYIEVAMAEVRVRVVFFKSYVQTFSSSGC